MRKEGRKVGLQRPLSAAYYVRGEERKKGESR